MLVYRTWLYRWHVDHNKTLHLVQLRVSKPCEHKYILANVVIVFCRSKSYYYYYYFLHCYGILCAVRFILHTRRHILLIRTPNCTRRIRTAIITIVHIAYYYIRDAHEKKTRRGVFYFGVSQRSRRRARILDDHRDRVTNARSWTTYRVRGRDLVHLRRNGAPFSGLKTPLRRYVHITANSVQYKRP